MALPEFIENPKPRIYLEYPYTVLDFEISGGQDRGHWRSLANGLLLACWKFVEDPQCIRVPCSLQVHWGSEFDLGPLLADIERSKFIVAHNAKFELGWLGRSGVDTRRILPYCTMLGEYVLAGNRKVPMGLDATAKRYGRMGKKSFVAECIHSGIDPSDIPASLLESYCSLDVEDTHAIFKRQVRRLDNDGLLPVAFARNIVSPVLADIETQGMALDHERIREHVDSIFQEYGLAKIHLDEIASGINFRSPKQLGAFLYDTLLFDELKDRRGNPVRTTAGKRSTDQETVAALKATTVRQRVFKDALGTISPLKKQVQILENMVKCCAEDGGLVFAQINQGFTQTHRLSSTGGKWGFQFHNFPRGFKPLFKARERGWLIFEGDAPQLEFRVAIDLGNDATGKKDIQEGLDIHQFAADILGVSRQDAKAKTFRPLYGGNSGTPREVKYYEAFRARYSDLYNTQTQWVYNVLTTGVLTTATGLKFYWPDTKMMRSGYVTNSTNIFNYPVQMFATGDIIPLTLRIIWDMLIGMKAKIVNTIHDSVICEAPPDEVDRLREIYRYAFGSGVIGLLSRLYNYQFSTPLGVGIKIGPHWGEGKEEKYE